MLLNKMELELAEFCTEDYGRPALNGIYITDQETIATDGHVMVKAKVKNRLPDDEFPKLEGFSETEEKIQPFILSKKDALEIVKALPKKTPLECLKMAKIDTVYTNNNGKAKIGVTNLSSTKVFTPTKVDAEFPDLQGVVDDIEKKEPKVKFAVNAMLLEKLAKLVRKTSIDKAYPVKITIYGENEAIRLIWEAENTDYYGILMPIKNVGETSDTSDGKETEVVTSESTVEESAGVTPAGQEADAIKENSEGGDNNANSNNGTTSNNKE